MKCPECLHPLIWSNDFDGEDESSPTIESVWCCNECDITVMKIYYLDGKPPEEEDDVEEDPI